MNKQQIKLNNGLITTLDSEDYVKYSKFYWKCHSSRIDKDGNSTNYASQAQTQGSGFQRNSERVFLHRKIMNARPGDEVIHIDGDGLNNTRENLKLIRK